MDKKRRGMTLIEMIICLAIIAICLVAVVRGYSNLTLLSLRGTEDAVVVSRTEALITELEGQAPKQVEGTLEGPWRYRTRLNGDHYSLEIWHDTRDERYEFALREGPL